MPGQNAKPALWARDAAMLHRAERPVVFAKSFMTSF